MDIWNWVEKLQGDLRTGMAHDASWRAEDFLAGARYPYSSDNCWAMPSGADSWGWASDEPYGLPDERYDLF